MNAERRPKAALESMLGGGDSSSLPADTVSGIYARCVICSAHSAPNAARICRRCALEKVYGDADTALETATDRSVVESVARRRARALDRRRVIDWHNELRRLREIARLRRGAAR